jgi:flagellar motor switch protein FliN/FliY
MSSPDEQPPGLTEDVPADERPVAEDPDAERPTDERPIEERPGETVVPDGATDWPEASASTPIADFDVRSLDVLGDIEVMVTAELGRTSMCLRDVMALLPGMVIEIGRSASEPIDMLVGGRVMGQGDVVVVDEQFGVRVTNIALLNGPAGSAPEPVSQPAT